MQRFGETRSGRSAEGVNGRAALVGIAMAIALAGGACDSSTPSVAGASPAATEQPAAPVTPRSPTSQATAPELIPQPAVSGLAVAPQSERIDLVMPTFSNPTQVTNPLFPVSSQRSVLLLGQVDGEPFRTEVTLLPDPRIIEWDGQQVETLVSQYVAYLGGRLHEVAYDFYAQADDGSVWYFGEDVFNFADGSIVDTHGTWIAGKDGPAAMIMPASPSVGDVYRPENIPGFVFEEVTVKAVDQTLDGPLGPTDGGLVIEELHMDGTTEGKTFAPGYGEFFTGGGGDVEALSLAVPTDALSTPVPPELVALERGATDVFAAVRDGRWAAAAADKKTMAAAWRGHRTGEIPPMIAARMSTALDALATAIGDRNAGRAGQAAIRVAQSALDLQLRHRPSTEIDLARFDLWAAQLEIDAANGDSAAMNGDFFAIDYIRDRILAEMDATEAARINIELETLLSTVGDEDFRAAVESARRLRSTLAGIVAGA